MGKEITTLIENEFVELSRWKVNELYDKSFFIKDTLEEGEKKLVEISRKADKEDCWTYLKEREIWVHSAAEYSAKLMKNGNILHKIKSSSLEFMEEIVDLDKQINYHTHPWGIFSGTYKSLSREKPQLKKFFINLFGSWLALPSGFDLKQTFLSSEERKIASPFGVTYYRLYSGNPPEQLYSIRKPTKFDAEIITKKGCEDYINFLTKEIKDKLPNVHLNLRFKRIRIK